MIVFIGGFTMYSWLFAQDTLGQSHPELFGATFNSSLCFTLAGLVYLFPFKKIEHSDLSKIIVGAFLVTISSLVLVQYIFKVSLGLDQLFVTVNIDTQFKNPGRMSSLTATAILTAGLAMIMLRTVKTIKWYYIIYILISTIIIMGVFGVLQNQIFDLALDKLNVNRVGYQTSFCLLALSIIMWTNWHKIASRVGFKFTDANIGKLVKLSIVYFGLVVTFSMILLALAKR